MCKNQTCLISPRQDPILSWLVGIHPTLANFLSPIKNRLVCDRLKAKRIQNWPVAIHTSYVQHIQNALTVQQGTKEIESAEKYISSQKCSQSFKEN